MSEPILTKSGRLDKRFQPKIKYKGQEYIGQKFNKLLVIAFIAGKKVLCLCDCGEECEANFYHLKYGHKKTCGDPIHKTGKNSPSFIHGYAGSTNKRKPEYTCYHQMHSRCYDPKNQDYHLYGGRLDGGPIIVCERWHKDNPDGFLNFIADMGDKPEPKHLYSIDRKNVNGNYEPSNCRWADAKTQANNQRKKEKTYFNCANCNKLQPCEPNKIKRSKLCFCNRKCYFEYRENHPELKYRGGRKNGSKNKK